MTRQLTKWMRLTLAQPLLSEETDISGLMSRLLTWLCKQQWFRDETRHRSNGISYGTAATVKSSDNAKQHSVKGKLSNWLTCSEEWICSKSNSDTHSSLHEWKMIFCVAQCDSWMEIDLWMGVHDHRHKSTRSRTTRFVSVWAFFQKHKINSRCCNMKCSTWLVRRRNDYSRLQETCCSVVAVGRLYWGGRRLTTNSWRRTRVEHKSSFWFNYRVEHSNASRKL